MSTWASKYKMYQQQLRKNSHLLVYFVVIVLLHLILGAGLYLWSQTFLRYSTLHQAEDTHVYIDGCSVHVHIDDLGSQRKSELNSILFEYSFDSRVLFSDRHHALNFSVIERSIEFGEFVACDVNIRIPLNRQLPLNLTLEFNENRFNDLNVNMPADKTIAESKNFTSLFTVKGSIFEIKVDELAVGYDYLFQDFEVELESGTLEIGSLVVGSSLETSNITHMPAITAETRSGDILIQVTSETQWFLEFKMDRPLFCTPTDSWINPTTFCAPSGEEAAEEDAYMRFKNCTGSTQSGFFSRLDPNANSSIGPPIGIGIHVGLEVAHGSISISPKKGLHYVDHFDEFAVLVNEENPNFSYRSHVDPELSAEFNLVYEKVKEQANLNFLFSVHLVHIKQGNRVRTDNIYQVSNLYPFISLPYAVTKMFSVSFEDVLTTFDGRLYPAICGIPPLYQNSVPVYIEAVASDSIGASLPTQLNPSYIAKHNSMRDIVRYVTLWPVDLDYIKFHTLNLSLVSQPLLLLLLLFSLTAAGLFSFLIMKIFLLFFYEYCLQMVKDKETADKFSFVYKRNEGLSKRDFSSQYDLGKPRSHLWLALQTSLNPILIVELIFLESKRYWIQSINVFISKHCTLLTDSASFVGKRSTPINSFFWAYQYFCVRNRIPGESVNFILEYLRGHSVFLKPTYQAEKLEIYQGIRYNENSRKQSYKESAKEGNIVGFLTNKYELTGRSVHQVSTIELHDAYKKYCIKTQKPLMRMTQSMMLFLGCSKKTSVPYEFENLILNHTAFADCTGTYKKRIQLLYQLLVIIAQFVFIVFLPVPSFLIIDQYESFSVKAKEVSPTKKHGYTYLLSDERSHSSPEVEIGLIVKDVWMLLFFFSMFVEMIFVNIIDRAEIVESLYFHSYILNAFKKDTLGTTRTTTSSRSISGSKQKHKDKSSRHGLIKNLLGYIRQANQKLSCILFLAYLFLYTFFFIIATELLYLQVYIKPTIFLPIASCLGTFVLYVSKKANKIHSEVTESQTVISKYVGVFIEKNSEIGNELEFLSDIDIVLDDMMGDLLKSPLVPQSELLQALSRVKADSIKELASKWNCAQSVCLFFISLLVEDIGSTFLSVSKMCEVGIMGKHAQAEKLNAFILLSWYSNSQQSSAVFSSVQSYILEYKARDKLNNSLSPGVEIRDGSIVFNLLLSLNQRNTSVLAQFIEKFCTHYFMQIPVEYYKVLFMSHSKKKRSFLVAQNLILLNMKYPLTDYPAERDIIKELLGPLCIHVGNSSKSGLGRYGDNMSLRLSLTEGFFRCLSDVLSLEIVDTELLATILKNDIGINMKLKDEWENLCIDTVTVLKALQALAQPSSMSKVFSRFCDFSLAREISVFVDAALFKRSSDISSMRLSLLAESFRCPPRSLKALLFFLSGNFSLGIEQLDNILPGTEQMRTNSIACSLLKLSLSTNVHVLKFAILHVRDELQLTIHGSNRQRADCIIQAEQFAYEIIKFRACVKSCCELWKKAQSENQNHSASSVYRGVIYSTMKSYDVFLETLGDFLHLKYLANDISLNTFKSLSLIVVDEGICNLLFPTNEVISPALNWINLGQILFGNGNTGKVLMLTSIFLSAFESASEERELSLHQYSLELKCDPFLVKKLHSLYNKTVNGDIDHSRALECSEILERYLDLGNKGSFRKKMQTFVEDIKNTNNCLKLLSCGLNIPWGPFSAIVCDAESTADANRSLVKQCLGDLFKDRSAFASVSNLGITGKNSTFSLVERSLRNMFPGNSLLSRACLFLSPFLFKQLKFLYEKVEDRLIMNHLKQQCKVDFNDLELLTSILLLKEFSEYLKQVRNTRGRTKTRLRVGLREKNISNAIVSFANRMGIDEALVKCTYSLYYDHCALLHRFLGEFAESFGIESEKSNLLIGVASGDISLVEKSINLLGMPLEILAACMAVSTGRYVSIQTGIPLIGLLQGLSSGEEAIVGDVLAAYHHQKSDFRYLSKYLGMSPSFLSGLSQMFFKGRLTFCFRYPSCLAAGFHFARDNGFSALMDFVSGDGRAMEIYLYQQGYPTHLFRASHLLLHILDSKKSTEIELLTGEFFNPFTKLLNVDIPGFSELLREVYVAGIEVFQDGPGRMKSSHIYKLARVVKLNDKEILALFEYCLTDFDGGLKHCERAFKGSFDSLQKDKDNSFEPNIIEILVLIYAVARIRSHRCFLLNGSVSELGLLCTRFIECCDTVYKANYFSPNTYSCSSMDLITLLSISQGHLYGVEDERVEMLADAFGTSTESLFTVVSLLNFWSEDEAQTSSDHGCRLSWIENFFGKFQVPLDIGTGLISLLNLKHCFPTQQEKLLNDVVTKLCSNIKGVEIVIRKILLVARKDFAKTMEFFSILGIPEDLGSSLMVSSITLDERRRGNISAYSSYEDLSRILKPLSEKLKIKQNVGIHLAAACSGNLQAFLNFACLEKIDSYTKQVPAEKVLFLLSLITDHDFLIQWPYSQYSSFLFSHPKREMAKFNVEIPFSSPDLVDVIECCPLSKTVLFAIFDGLGLSDERRLILLGVMFVICDWYPKESNLILEDLACNLLGVQRGTSTSLHRVGDILHILTSISQTKNVDDIYLSKFKVDSFCNKTLSPCESSKKREQMKTLVVTLTAQSKASLCLLLDLLTTSNDNFSAIKDFITEKFSYTKSSRLLGKIFARLKPFETEIVLSLLFKRSRKLFRFFQCYQSEFPMPLKRSNRLACLLLKWYVQKRPLSRSEIDEIASSLAALSDKKRRLEAGGLGNLSRAISSLLGTYQGRCECLLEYLRLDARHGSTKNQETLTHVISVDSRGSWVPAALLLKIAEEFSLTTRSAKALVLSIKAKELILGSAKELDDKGAELVDGAKEFLGVKLEHINAFLKLSSREFSEAFCLLLGIKKQMVQKHNHIQQTMSSLNVIIRTQETYDCLKFSLDYLTSKSRQGKVRVILEDQKEDVNHKFLLKAFDHFSKDNKLNLDAFRDAYKALNLGLSESQSYSLFVYSIEKGTYCDYEGFVASFKEFKSRVTNRILESNSSDFKSKLKVEIKWFLLLSLWLGFIIMGAMALNNQKNISAAFYGLSAVMGGASGLFLSKDSFILLRDSFFFEKEIEKAVLYEKGWFINAHTQPKKK